MSAPNRIQHLPQTELYLDALDCLQGMQQILPNSVDLVVTSPPYNLGIKYRSYEDNKGRADYLEWCMSWARAIHRVLKADGSFFLNVAGSPSNPLLPFELAHAFTAAGLYRLQNTIHWIKSISIEDGENTISRGHFKPINSQRFLNDCHEYVFHFTKTGSVPIDRLAVGVPYQDKSNISRWGHTSGKDKRCRGNTWFIPYRTIQSRDAQRPHPATFPAELVENCILLHGSPRDVVMMDPFVGIGSAAVAAIRAGVRKFIGFDIDEFYISEAKIAADYEHRNHFRRSPNYS